MSEHNLIHVEMRGPHGYVLTPACTCGWYSPNGSHLAFERHVRDAADGGHTVSYTSRQAIHPLTFETTVHDGRDGGLNRAEAALARSLAATMEETP